MLSNSSSIQNDWLTDDTRSPNKEHIGVIDGADNEHNKEDEKVSNNLGWPDG